MGGGAVVVGGAMAAETAGGGEVIWVDMVGVIEPARLASRASFLTYQIGGGYINSRRSIVPHYEWTHVTRPAVQLVTCILQLLVPCHLPDLSERLLDATIRLFEHVTERPVIYIGRWHLGLGSA